MNAPLKRPTLGLPKKTPDAVDRPQTLEEMVMEIRWRQRQIEQVKERILATVGIAPGMDVVINDGGSLGKKMVVVTTHVEESESGSWEFVAIGLALMIDGKPGTRRGIHRMTLPEA